MFIKNGKNCKKGIEIIRNKEEDEKQQNGKSNLSSNKLVTFFF